MDTVVDSVGDRVVVVGSAAAVRGMTDRRGESAGLANPTEAQGEALGLAVRCRVATVGRECSIPATRRATALAELSPTRLCLNKLNAHMRK